MIMILMPCTPTPMMKSQPAPRRLRNAIQEPMPPSAPKKMGNSQAHQGSDFFAFSFCSLSSSASVVCLTINLLLASVNAMDWGALYPLARLPGPWPIL